jgi:hypothetical protein
VAAVRASPLLHSYGAGEEHKLQHITRVTGEINASLLDGYYRVLDNASQLLRPHARRQNVTTTNRQSASGGDGILP